MNMRNILSVLFLSLPLTCFGLTVDLPILVSSAHPGNMPGWTVVDFSVIKPIAMYQQRDWTITCDYTVVGQGMLTVAPEFNGDLSHWSGRVIDGDLDWSTGSHTETFWYVQHGMAEPYHLGFQILNGDPVLLEMKHPCVAVTTGVM